MKPKVSIIITTTRPNLILSCVKSILLQSYKNIEIIIVDDNTGKSKNYYVDLFKYVLNKVKFKINKEKLGTSISRNIGYTMVDKPDYVMFHDDDDISQPNKIETLVNFLETNNKYSFVGSLFDCIDINNNIINEKCFIDNDSRYKRNLEYESIYYSSDTINHFIPSCV